MYTTPCLKGEWGVTKWSKGLCIYSLKCSIKANNLKHVDIHNIGTRSVSGGSVTKMKKFEC